MRKFDNKCPSHYQEAQYRIISQHPCYDEKAVHKFGRLHLAVAPNCNIKCNYCDRKFDCVNESRPGVASKLLSPTEALEKTKIIIDEYPNIKVVGVAGPGDPLANETTFETFDLIRNEFPDLTLCMSTNGLLLSEKMPEIVKLGIATLTVTLNAIDKNIQSKICSEITFKDQKYKDIEAADILINNQLEGIKGAVKAGIFIKINTVLIPGVNDQHIVDIAKEIRKMEVYIMNIMPLINQAAFSHIIPPTGEECRLIQNECKMFIRQMRHCRQCRADEYGLLNHKVLI